MKHWKGRGRPREEDEDEIRFSPLVRIRRSVGGDDGCTGLIHKTGQAWG